MGRQRYNVKRILEHVEAAAKQGSDLIIFTETALTGYDDEDGKLLKRCIVDLLKQFQALLQYSRID